MSLHSYSNEDTFGLAGQVTANKKDKARKSQGKTRKVYKLNQLTKYSGQRYLLKKQLAVAVCINY